MNLFEWLRFSDKTWTKCTRREKVSRHQRLLLLFLEQSLFDLQLVEEVAKMFPFEQDMAIFRLL